MKRVAVVILNWNGEKFLRQFLSGVVRCSEEMADVYVVDNCSNDNSIQYIREEHPTVAVVELTFNYGFAGGYNHGLKDIPHEFYVLLNSDVEVTPNWITPVLAYMDSVPGMVACQPKIMDYHRKEWFEYAGAAGGYIDKDSYAFCAGRIFYKFENDQGQYHKNEEVFWASGASLFIKRSAWLEVGGLDIDFFAHMEEIDLCWRLKNRGYKIGACRDSIIYHYGGGTLDRFSPFKTYLNFRNNLFMIVKNSSRGNLLHKVVRRLLLDGLAAFRFLSEGKFGFFSAVLKAHYSFYKGLPRQLKKRKIEEKYLQSPNLTGLYNASIIKHFFLFKKHSFTVLDENLFDRGQDQVKSEEHLLLF